MSQKTIWVVEDEEDILALIYYNLVKEGYSVRGFTSGEEMLAALEEARPDLFLLDVMLPGVDGLGELMGPGLQYLNLEASGSIRI